MLKADQDDGVVNAVDRQSSDVINLVTMLYEAIWEDESVPIPIKELIGRTQVTIIKVALSDTEFFNRENHPARAILNEFAAAGIGWTEVEKLEEDPLYQKIQEQVNHILLEYDDDVATIPGGERVVAAAIESFGRLDGLVCCAGILGPAKPLWELTEDEWDAVVRVHMKGHFCCSRAAIPVMIEQGAGRLIFFSASAAIAAATAGIGPGDVGPYGAAKAGVLGLMWGAAVSLIQMDDAT